MESVQKLTHIEHILKRPDSYVGPVEQGTEPYWILDGSTFTKKNLKYSPALLKIFDEILVNAIDRNSLHPKQVSSISVAIDKESGSVTIENNGPLGGIGVRMHEKEGLWNPELVFGHLLTSTNYDDTQKRIVGGRNGYGAKLANIYSSDFSVVIKDHETKQTYTQKWSKNMTVCDPPKIKKHSGATSSVSITFTPEWKRFGMSKMDDTIYNIFQKRVWDANICTTQNCKVKFNGDVLPKQNFETYAKMHEGVQEVASVTGDRWSVCIGPSENGLEQVSFVNGICTMKGGTHVDHVANHIANGIIDDMAKKIKLKPQQVKNAFTIFVKATLENPTFSRQVKSERTSKSPDFGSKFEPPKNFVKNVLKTGIADELTALSKFKEMKELKKTDGARKSKITGIPKLDDANKAGTAQSEKCTLIVTEGDSASGSITKSRDVNTQAVFSLKSKPLNSYGLSKKIVYENEEFNLLQAALNIEDGLEDLRYNNIVIATDADVDGSHIQTLLLTFFFRYYRDIVENGYLYLAQPPLYRYKKGKKEIYFKDDREMNDFLIDNGVESLEIENVGHNDLVSFFKL